MVISMFPACGGHSPSNTLHLNPNQTNSRPKLMDYRYLTQLHTIYHGQETSNILEKRKETRPRKKKSLHVTQRGE